MFLAWRRRQKEKLQRTEASTTMHFCGVLERGARRRSLCESLTWFNANTAVPRGVIPDRCFEISSAPRDRTGPARLWSSRSRCRRPSTCHGCRTLFFVDLFKLSDRSTEACLSLCYPRFLVPGLPKKTGRVARNLKAMVLNARWRVLSWIVITTL